MSLLVSFLFVIYRWEKSTKKTCICGGKGNYKCMLARTTQPPTHNPTVLLRTTEGIPKFFKGHHPRADTLRTSTVKSGSCLSASCPSPALLLPTSSGLSEDVFLQLRRFTLACLYHRHASHEGIGAYLT